LPRSKATANLCDELSAEKIDALLPKWLRLLPHPYTAQDRKAGYRYQVSIPQAEFSLTQVLDRPVTGRVFLEEVIRENLDIGRPSQVIFDRGATRRRQAGFGPGSSIRKSQFSRVWRRYSVISQLLI
jgi:hypothetical protein